MWFAVTLLAMTPAFATSVNVVGLFPGKAVVVINGASPRTMSVGQRSSEGILLVSTDAKSATFEIDGKRRNLEIGEPFSSSAPGGSGQSVTLAPDTRGHYVIMGSVNGGTVRFLVDTGASLVVLPAADARRLGIDYKQGKLGYANSANGVVAGYLIKLDSVQVGDIVINQVDASVQESGLNIALLGMAFLNRTEMRREGMNMTLTKRF